jgi:hypothetical protein
MRLSDGVMMVKRCDLLLRKTFQIAFEQADQKLKNMHHSPLINRK